jgi:IPT/TIG domain
MFFKYFHKLLLVLLISLMGCDTAGDTNSFDPDGSVEPDVPDISSFRVTLVDPAHGPAIGGQEVTIRGFGFTETTRIYFGGHWVDPNEILFVDANRMLARVPAGYVGVVDVKAVNNDTEETTLENGYIYDRFSIDPPSGSITGGTFVRITSPLNDFNPSDQFLLGDTPLIDLNYVSTGLIMGKTPEHLPETVDFVVNKQDGTVLRTYEAYEYFDTTDPSYGGMSGEPINGTITVTVLNYYGHTPLEGVFVLLGVDLNSPFQGATNENGQITFSNPDLKGAQMLTAALDGYEIVSFIGFDSSEITLFLIPFDPPATPPGTGGIPDIPRSVYSTLSGGVLFLFEEHTYSCNWDDMIPPAPEGYRRVVKLYQSLRSYDVQAPQIFAIYDSSECLSGFGYPFVITMWPGSFALYGLAGYESNDGLTFNPIAYGIVRHIVVGPGDEYSTVLLIENYLDNTVSVDLINPPPLDAVNGPFKYETKLVLNIGADGYLIRKDSTVSQDSTQTIVFENQFHTVGNLADGTFSVFSQASTNGAYPFSKTFLSYQTGSSIDVDTFLGIPEPVEPVDEVVSNNRFAFQPSLIKPTFVRIAIKTFPEGRDFWRIYVNGELSSFMLPNLDVIDNTPKRPTGDLYWHIQSILIPDLDFNSFTYRYLSEKYWLSNAGTGAKFRY